MAAFNPERMQHLFRWTTAIRPKPPFPVSVQIDPVECPLPSRTKVHSRPRLCENARKSLLAKIFPTVIQHLDSHVVGRFADSAIGR